MRPLLIFVAAASLVSAGAPELRNSSQRFVVRDVRVFDGEHVVESTTVAVQDGFVASVGTEPPAAQGYEVVDGRGRTLLPGLIDAHVHVADDAESALEQALMMGVTTVLDMFSAGERLQRLERIAATDPTGMADVRSAGTGATAPGGHPTQMAGPVSFPTISAAEDAAAFVDARIAEGSDYIKVIYDDLSSMRAPVPMLDRSTLAALVAAAHRRGRVAVVHVLSEWQARDAVEAGADVLVHLFRGDRSPPDFGELAAKHGTAVIPTLSVICANSEAEELLADATLRPFLRPVWRQTLRIPVSRPPCGGAESALKQLLARQVPILAGTDAPTPGTTYGASLHGELSLLVRAGLTPQEALAAATSVTARVFSLKDRGAIRSGLRADLVLVDGDPTRDIEATRRIVRIWKRGVPVERHAADPAH